MEEAKRRSRQDYEEEVRKRAEDEPSTQEVREGVRRWKALRAREEAGKKKAKEE